MRNENMAQILNEEKIAESISIWRKMKRNTYMRK